MLNKVVCFIVVFYQKYISVFLAPRCRFYPCCSQYAFQSFQRFPFLKASFLFLRRIMKCHPLHSGGVDEVPCG